MKNILYNRPFRKGTIIKILTMKPKKPNSALRKIAKVSIDNLIITTYIPGISHNLNIHNQVLIKGGKIQDLPNVNYVIVRGALDCNGVINRKTSRSKYGTKKQE